MSGMKCCTVVYTFWDPMIYMPLSHFTVRSISPASEFPVKFVQQMIQLLGGRVLYASMSRSFSYTIFSHDNFMHYETRSNEEPCKIRHQSAVLYTSVHNNLR